MAKKKKAKKGKASKDSEKPEITTTPAQEHERALLKVTPLHLNILATHMAHFYIPSLEHWSSIGYQLQCEKKSRRHSC